VRNAARAEIVAALRARQNVVLSLSRTIVGVRMSSRNHLDFVRCERAFEEYRAVAGRDDAQWITLLEAV
jgi:hypothetical protein